jgi:hypothetical protein
LLVIHQAHQRPSGGRVGEQAQDAQADQEPVRGRPGADAERGPQRRALRIGQALETIQHRRAQLMQRGEGELHLRLDPHHPRDPAAVRTPGQVVKQSGLAYPRLAPHHQRPARAGADRLDQLIEYGTFGAPPAQLRGVSSWCRMRSRHAWSAAFIGFASSRAVPRTWPWLKSAGFRGSRK